MASRNCPILKHDVYFKICCPADYSAINPAVRRLSTELSIRHVVAIAVLMHALMGCCAHHGHAADSSCDQGCLHASSAEDGAATHTHDDGVCSTEEKDPTRTTGDEGRHDSDVPRDGCDGEQCNWLPSEAGLELADVPQPGLNAWVATSDFLIDLRVRQCHLEWRFANCGPPPLPVRTHLAKSVLLI